MRNINIPVFVPHKGCPNDCVFCNQKKITGIEFMTPQKAKENIESYIKTLPENANCSIAFFGGSFTAIEEDVQKQFLSVAKQYIDSGIVSYTRISTRPDCITKENLEMLYGYGVRAIELGVQSTDDEVLSLSNRGHNFEDVKKSVALIKNHGGFELGLQMMTGLPGDTFEKTLKTAHDIISLGSNTTRIYPTLVIKNSKLADMYKRHEYSPLTVEEAVERCAEVYKLFSDAGVTVLRIGLMSSGKINESGGDVIAGPVHSSFGELVLSRIFYNKIIPVATKKNSLKILVNPKDLSKAIGNKKSNIKAIYEKTGCNVTIEADKNVCINDIKFVKEDALCI